MKKDVAFFDVNKTGDILSRISSDTAVVQDGLGTNISMFMRSFIFILGTLGVLGYISWDLTLVTFGGVIPVILVYVGYAVLIRKLQKTLQDRKGELG
jgi:ABC-type multidrug transport system fused ATPase/permease subunit